MKKSLLFLVVAVSFLMSGCLKSTDSLGYSTTTTYKGKVVSKTTHTPLADVQVALVGDNHESVILKTRTNSSGQFELKVDYNTLDWNSGILIKGGNNYNDKFLKLQGAGNEYFDYETVELVEKGGQLDDYVTFNYAGHRYVVLGMSSQAYGWNSSGMTSYFNSLSSLASQLGCTNMGMISLGEAEALVKYYSKPLDSYTNIVFWSYEDAEEEGYVYVYSCTIIQSGGYYLSSDQSDGSGAKHLLVVGQLN